MTIARSASRIHHRTARGAASAGSWFSAGVIAALALLPSFARAQNGADRRADAPVAPSQSVGVSSTSSTFSLMGLSGLPNSDNASVPVRDVLFSGLSIPSGRFRGVRFTTIGTGYWRARNAVASSSAAEGAVAVRALGRINGVRSWAAIRYGYAGALGGVLGGGFDGTPDGIGFDGVRTDTTISHRVDIGTVARAEAGVLTSRHGFDFSLGMSLERATRVTTQTIRIQASEEFPTSPMPSAPTAIVRTLRGVQRREIATGLASLAWSTGHTNWIASVSAPVAAWITRDALAPRPRVAPAVATLAVVQPITAWLSAIGSASTNSSTVGSSALRDDIALTRHSDFAPVLALGVSIVRIPFLARHGEAPLNGILSFESRIVDVIDSVSIINQTPTDTTRFNASTTASYRVQLVIDAPTAASVEMMGDATAWVVTNMNRGSDGRWRAEFKVPAGAHRLAVRTDGGEWIAPPGLPLGNNDFGSPVGLLMVVAQPQNHR